MADLRTDHRGDDRRGMLRGRPVLALFLAVAAVGILSVSRPALAAAPPSPVASELRDRSVEIIRKVFASEQRWVKVHAAEYLLALDHSEGVEEAFMEELKAHGDEPQYRIGIWRVLARASYKDKEREEWTKKICEVFFDTASPDRLHAAETLAKLGYKLKDSEVAATEAAASEDKPWAPYATWILLNSGVKGAEARLAAMLDSKDVDTRVGAA